MIEVPISTWKSALLCFRASGVASATGFPRTCHGLNTNLPANLQRSNGSILQSLPDYYKARCKAFARGATSFEKSLNSAIFSGLYIVKRFVEKAACYLHARAL